MMKEKAYAASGFCPGLQEPVFILTKNPLSPETAAAAQSFFPAAS
jgi:hypothetical protein